uniref:Ubiquitin-like protease family profile domain-containing protein n=1 Tax=Ditylenchus dipsaci TaxID=166011 RepID=A0A915DF98_9BILA
MIAQTNKAAVNLLLRFTSWDGTDYNNLIKEFSQEYAVEYGYEALAPSNWIAFCPKDIPRQTNTFDCVFFICQYAECVCRGSLNFTEAQMDVIRNEMMRESFVERCNVEYL